VVSASSALMGVGMMGMSGLLLGEMVDFLVKSFISNQLNAFNFFI
jgi:hypothetical protein